MSIQIVREQRKNADGSYDIIHPETQAKVVWFEDGESLQQKYDNKESNNDLLETVVIKDTVYWDGNTEGKTVIDPYGDGSGLWCHISDVTPSLDDLANGVISEWTYSDGFIQEVPFGDFQQVSNDIIVGDSGSVVIVSKDNASDEDLTFPKKGIYVIYFTTEDYSGYISKLQILGYEGFDPIQSEFIKEKYLDIDYIVEAVRKSLSATYILPASIE